MKVKTLLKVFTLITIALAATDQFYAQSIVIKFDAGEMTVEQSLLHLEAQTPYHVTFNRNKLDVNRKVHFSGAALPIEKALEHILSQSGSHYTVQGKYILIAKKQTDDKRELPADQKHAAEQKPTPIVPPPIASIDDLNAWINPGIHNDTYRRRKTTPPAIRMVEKNKVLPEIRSEIAGEYRSCTIPVQSHPINRLPSYALKTNLLHGLATLTPNLGVEFGLTQRTTLELHAVINPWKLQSNTGDNRKLAHLLVRPEFRYWLSERFNGHFAGIHLLYAHYNIGSYDIPLLFEKEYRYQGFGYGAGISYGYFLPFNKRWGMEFTLGAGMVRLDYDQFHCAGCEKNSQPGKKNYIGPTRVGINLVFNIK